MNMEMNNELKEILNPGKTVLKNEGFNMVKQRKYVLS